LRYLKRDEEALAAFTQALELVPTAASAVQCAAALYRLQRYEEALPLYERALNLNPTSANLLSWRGETLFELNCYKEGMTSCQRAIELDSVDGQAWFFSDSATKDSGDKRNRSMLSHMRPTFAIPPPITGMQREMRSMGFNAMRTRFKPIGGQLSWTLSTSPPGICWRLCVSGKVTSSGPWMPPNRR
jgi:tetratricopeptide (TPR) repeat protein